MKNYQEHIISVGVVARDALKRLSDLPDIESRTLFVSDDEKCLVGTITDGDIRRGLLAGLEISDSIDRYMNRKFRFLLDKQYTLADIKQYKKQGIELVPLLDSENRILKILDLSTMQSVIPASALLMAGGRGERLRPFTDSVPKPMLKIGDKPIIEHNIDRLIQFGISDVYISIKYLGEQIRSYLGDGSSKGISIHYIEETEALGTIGALSLAGDMPNDNILVMNSDLLTNIDIEDFYVHYLNSQANMCIASIPYSVNVPYAVLQTEESSVLSFIEKPTYTYYSNAGLYFIRNELRKEIPYGQFYNATDLIDLLIQRGNKVSHYPILGYWLDIGKHQDFLKAQEDIKHIRF